jgi:hypothetical protein
MGLVASLLLYPLLLQLLHLLADGSSDRRAVSEELETALRRVRDREAREPAERPLSVEIASQGRQSDAQSVSGLECISVLHLEPILFLEPPTRKNGRWLYGSLFWRWVGAVQALLKNDVAMGNSSTADALLRCSIRECRCSMRDIRNPLGEAQSATPLKAAPLQSNVFTSCETALGKAPAPWERSRTPVCEDKK